MKRIITLLFIILFFFPAFSQITLWNDSFDSQIGKGVSGNGVDLSGVNWTLDYSDCSLGDGDDYVKVDSHYSHGRFTAKHCGGEAIWESEEITITNYINVKINVNVGETGSSDNAIRKYIKLYSVVDGIESPFVANGEGWGNFGSKVATTTADVGDKLKIRVKLKSTLAQKVYFNAIEVTGEQGTTPYNDADSEISISDAPILAQTFTAVEAHTASREVFRFKVTDKGTADGKPTVLTKIVLNKGVNNTLNWENKLEEVIVRAGTVSFTGNIVGNDLVFDIPENEVSIADNNSQEFTLSIKTVENIADNSKFQVLIDANHSFETSNTGSTLTTVLAKSIVSGSTTINVKATRLFVIEQPVEETVGKPFEQNIVAQLEDDYGNIDTDNTLSSARISIANGTGTLSPMSELTQQFSNGICQWKNLIYNRVETATFKIEAGGFSINSQPITFLKGQTSLIEKSANPIANDTISTIRNTELKAKDCFKFKIVDKGDDGLPTIIEKIRFVKGDAFSQSRLYYLIGGIILKKHNTIIGQLNQLDASNASSDVEITLNAPLTIGDGSQVEIAASIYLSRYKKLQDGEKIQLAIDKKHGWLVSDEGSLLVSPLAEDISSSILTIDAIATQLAFEEVPKNITVNTPFTVSVIATDANGKIDSDYNGTVTLSREAGTGILSSNTGLTLNFTNGKAMWSSLQYDTGENFTLLATSPNFAPVESPAISSVDKDSEILAPEKQLPASVISSLITQETAPKEIFSFTIADKGTNDKQPTILKALSFKNTFLSNSANWKANIKGAVLLQNGKIIATTDKISNEEIIFSSTNGIVSIPDGTKQNFMLAVYLKYNNIEDNKLIQCKISSTKTDFKTDGIGSALGNLDTDIISSITTIEVKATQVDFLDVPYALHTPKKPFSVNVGARDTNGNIDTDYTAQLSLADTQQLATTNFINGVATVEAIVQNGNTDFHLAAKSGSLTSANHDVKISPVAIDLEDDFESGTFNGWLFTTDWKPSILNPINGEKSLKHNLNNTSGTSHIAKSIGNFNLKNGTTIWRWQMKNGDWKPSSSNNFYYVLAAESSDFSNGIRYIVGVHQSGSTDLLSLYKIQDEKTTTLLTSEMNWNDSETVGIQVKLDSEGKWELAYDNNGGFDNLYTSGSTTDNVLPTGMLYSGFVFDYASASRAGLFWADDVITYHFATSPKVDSLKVISATELKIFFSQKMDKASIENIQNYRINKNIKVIDAKQEEPNEVTLSVATLKTDTYQITLKGLKNDVAILMPNTTLTFNYFNEAQKGEVIINEMMIDENPAVKLPEYEYIELYNTTEKPFILKDWTITVGAYERTIPADTIQPDEYILLCATNAKEALSAYGKTIAVTSFPTLANSGATVVLKNTAKVEIDNVTYAKDWYNDKAKNEGGWSLERIDPKAASNNRANWSAAYDERGGTPGEKNSVFGVVLDNVSPQVVRVAPISKKQLVITLSEPIDALAAQQPNLYVVNGFGKPETVLISEDGMVVTLTFKDELEYGKTYSLTIKEIIDLFGNALENASATFGLPEIALANELIINEILFNPVSGNVDYVELYNHSNKILDLSTVFMATREGRGNLKSVYPLSKEARMLSPEEFVVVTINPELVAKQYEVKYPERMLEMAALPSFPNDKGIVVLLNQENTVIDEFHYNDDMHLKLLVSTDGVSLERIYYDLPTQDRNNWHSAAEVAGYGTPTYKNSAFSEHKPINEPILIDPKVFSPNGDGIDDFMQIHYQFEEPGQVANITIFDSKGRLIIDLARSVTLDTRGIISWDGVNADNQRVRTGRYVIFIELFDVNGNVRTYKKTCVLHGLFK